MSDRDLRIGELAKRVGISVRTLHHYDDIGLLRARRPGPGEHRFYGPSEVARLQQIVSLRQLGLSLAEIRTCLEGEKPTLLQVVERHRARLEDRLRAEERLRDRLATLAGWLRRDDVVPLEALLETLEITMKFEEHYSPEQLEKLKRRAEEVGEDRIRDAEQEWRTLIAAVRVQMNQGADPTSEPVLALARQWDGLIKEFTGGDPGIERSLARANAAHPDAHRRHGMDLDSEMMQYIGRALKTLGAGPDTTGSSDG